MFILAVCFNLASKILCLSRKMNRIKTHTVANFDFPLSTLLNIQDCQHSVGLVHHSYI